MRVVIEQERKRGAGEREFTFVTAVRSYVSTPSLFAGSHNLSLPFLPGLAFALPPPRVSRQVNQKQGELTEEEQAARKALNLRIKEENRRRALERAEEMARQKELEAKANADELRFR